MKILVFGCGAVGSVFGGFLSQSKHEIFLYGRSWHLAKVRRHGLRIEGIWGEHRFRKFRIFENFTQLRKQKIPLDLVLLTVKSFDTENACRELRGIVRPQTLILSLQNGLGNIEILRRYFSPRQVLAGRVIFGAELAPGKVKITVSADSVRLGETSTKKITKRVGDLCSLFTRCGIETKAVANIRQSIWAKVIYNCALNPLASLLGVHYGALLESSCTRDLMRRIVEETYSVAEKGHFKLVPGEARAYVKLLFRKLIPATYDHHPSMLQDMLRKKRTEIDALNGAVCELGKKFEVNTPVNQIVTYLIKAREELYC